MQASKHSLSLAVQVCQNVLVYSLRALQHTASQLTAPMLPQQCLIPLNLKLIIIPWARVNLTYTWHLISTPFTMYYQYHCLSYFHIEHCKPLAPQHSLIKFAQCWRVRGFMLPLVLSQSWPTKDVHP